MLSGFSALIIYAVGRLRDSIQSPGGVMVLALLCVCVSVVNVSSVDGHHRDTERSRRHRDGLQNWDTASFSF